MRKYTLFISGVFIVGLFTIGFDKPQTADLDNDQTTTASLSSFDIRVNTVGVLDTARSQMIASTVMGNKGRIIYIVEEGAKVNEGDILAKLDPTPFNEEVVRLGGEVKSRESAVKALEQVLEWEKGDFERQVETAEFNLKAAELGLEKIQKGETPLQLAQYKSEMDKANQEYTRYAAYLKDLETLKEKGYGQTTEIAQAKERVESLRETYETAKEKHLNYKNYVMPSLIETERTNVKRAEMELERIQKDGVFKVAKAMADLEKARHELDTVRSTLEQAKAELDKTVIRAPMSGIAILYETFRDGQKRKPRIGDTVWQNQPLLYLPDISYMIVKTQIREVDLHKVAIGKNAAVQVDAYPDALFEGVVAAIGILATEAAEGIKGEKYFQLTVVVKEGDARLRPGMTARISIHADSVRNALSIPIHAVFNEDGRKYCYVYTGKGFRKVEITSGRQNEDIVEVVSGLKKGDRVSFVKPGEEK